jgi:phenylacetate-CoA ligase
MSNTKMSKSELKIFREKRIRHIVKYAFEHVLFYHEEFQRANILPDDIKTIDDLNKIPIIGKKDLQQNVNRFISDEFAVENLRAIHTSGSTGYPLTTYLSKSEDEFRKAKLLRPHIICGQKPWDSWVLVGPPNDQKRISRFQKLMRIYSPRFVSIFDSPKTQITNIRQHRPDVLDGYSGSLFLIAKELEKHETLSIQPKFTIGGAEVLDKHSRSIIELAFNSPYYDQYASEEFQMLAWQCKEKNQYHQDADTVVMQFVDKNSDEVTPGVPGNIVCTSLFNLAMPLIRYNMGDLGISSDADDCACGKNFPLMKTIEGRKELAILLPDGRSLTPLSIGVSVCDFEKFHEIIQYRFIQKKRDFFKILIHKRDDGTSASLLGQQLETHLRKTLKLNESQATFETEFVKDIPLDPSGKFRKIYSELTNEN